MPEYVSSHYPQLWYWLVEEHLALYVCAGLYGVYCLAIFKMGLVSMENKRTGQVCEAYPRGYFLWLAIQMFPLFLTGMALGDGFIALTRGITLVLVVVVYAMVKNPTGIFKYEDYRLPVGVFFIGILILGTLWLKNEQFRNVIKAYHAPLGIISFVTTILFLYFGQWATGKSVRERFLGGQYNLRGFLIQWVRLAIFLLQGFYYTVTEGLIDPRSLNGWVATIGAVVIINSYVWGLQNGKRTQPAQAQAA